MNPAAASRRLLEQAAAARRAQFQLPAAPAAAPAPAPARVEHRIYWHWRSRDELARYIAAHEPLLAEMNIRVSCRNVSRRALRIPAIRRALETAGITGLPALLTPHGSYRGLRAIKAVYDGNFAQYRAWQLEQEVAEKAPAAHAAAGDEGDFDAVIRNRIVGSHTASSRSRPTAAAAAADDEAQDGKELDEKPIDMSQIAQRQQLIAGKTKGRWNVAKSMATNAAGGDDNTSAMDAAVAAAAAQAEQRAAQTRPRGRPRASAGASATAARAPAPPAPKPAALKSDGSAFYDKEMATLMSQAEMAGGGF